MSTNPLFIGIDGGGTQCRAWLASLDLNDEMVILGRGTGGPVNPQAVGFPAAFTNLNAAISAAFTEAGLQQRPVDSAVLAAAGSDREENRRAFVGWACEFGLAKRFQIVHDALPVLITGCPDGWGIALISGTGSLAFGRAPDGRTARAGGWGFLFGDEGSAYAIAMAGLRAAAQAADGRAPPTRLLEAFSEHFKIARAEELVSAVYALQNDRAAQAALARIVVQTADRGDAAAQRILDQAAADLTAMVLAVARKLKFPPPSFTLAVTGGMILETSSLRNQLCTELAAAGYEKIAPVMVFEPVRGALKMAYAEYRKQED